MSITTCRWCRSPNICGDHGCQNMAELWARPVASQSLRQNLTRSCAGLRLVKPTTIEEIEEELATVRSKIEPLTRREADLIELREQLWREIV